METSPLQTADIPIIESALPAVKKAAIGRYWRKILGYMSDAVIVYDLDGYIVYANNSASDNMRYISAEQLMHKNVNDFAERYMFFDESGRHLEMEDLPSRRAMRENAIIEKIVHVVAAQGNENFWVASKAFPITDKSRKPKFVVVCYHDITSLKKAEEMLKDSNRRIAGILDDLLKLD